MQRQVKALTTKATASAGNIALCASVAGMVLKMHWAKLVQLCGCAALEEGSKKFHCSADFFPLTKRNCYCIGTDYVVSGDDRLMIFAAASAGVQTKNRLLSWERGITMTKNLLSFFGMFFSITTHAQTITSLDFNTLPSAQGWTYMTGHSSTPDLTPTVPEASIFSVANGVLQQNTLGQGSLEAVYALQNYANFTESFTVFVRARVLAQDNGSDPYGLEIGFHSDTWGTGFGVGTGIIKDFTGAILSNGIDTSVFHDYKFVGNPDDSYTFYIDGMLTATGNGVLYSSLPYTVADSDKQIIYFGDGTPSGSNARADIANYTFTQGSAAVPEPATIWLFGSVLPIFLATSERRKRLKQLTLKLNRPGNRGGSLV